MRKRVCFYKTPQSILLISLSIRLQFRMLFDCDINWKKKYFSQIIGYQKRNCICKLSDYSFCLHCLHVCICFDMLASLFRYMHHVHAFYIWHATLATHLTVEWTITNKYTKCIYNSYVHRTLSKSHIVRTWCLGDENSGTSWQDSESLEHHIYYHSIITYKTRLQAKGVTLYMRQFV